MNKPRIPIDFESLVSRLPDIVLFHVDYVIEYVNDSVTSIAGYGKDDVVGKSVLMFLPPEEAEKVDRYSRMRSAALDAPDQYETKIIHKDGRLLDVEVRVLRMEIGGHEGRLNVLTDISERKRIAKVEERFSNFADMLPETVYESDAAGVIRYVNRAGLMMFGYDSSYMSLNLCITDMFPPEELARVMAQRTSTLQSGESRRVEFRARRRDGSTFPVIIHTIPMYENGIVSGTRGMVIDITERKKQEELIAAEREILQVTLSAIGEGVITIDGKGKIRLMNRAAERMCGIPLSDAEHRDIDDVLTFARASSGEKLALRDEIDGIDRPLYYSDLDYRMIPGSGREIPVIIEIFPLHDPASSGGIGYVIVFRDMTEELKLEDNRLRTIKLESLGVLAGGIAHDFNNILTSLLGNISLASMSVPDSHEVSELLRDAEKAAYRAKSLTQQLLTLSMGGAPVKSSASIGELVRECAAFVLRGSNVSCAIDIPAELPSIEVDEGQIFQVINNLLINSMQAMPGGGNIGIEVISETVAEHNAKRLAPGGYIRITVRDAGPGIPAKDIDRIFDPYYTTKPGGHGLGLATTYSIISKHNGIIEVSSEPGNTVFTLYLPAGCAAALVDRKAPSADSKKSGKILVLEDEDSISSFLGKFFEKSGFRAVFTAEGNETIRAYGNAFRSEDPFDVVLLDLTIPGGMGGREVITELLKLDPAVKAVSSSGYYNDETMSDYRMFGFSARISKPYLLSDLSAVIKSLIEG